MATSPASEQDLVRRSLRPLTADERQWAGTRLQDAFVQIVTRRPSVATRLDAGNDGDPFHSLVIQVQVAMVLRVLANPEYAREQASDDATLTLDAAVSSGALYVSDDELALLSLGDDIADTAFTIRTPRAAAYPGRPGAGFPTTTTGTW